MKNKVVNIMEKASDTDMILNFTNNRIDISTLKNIKKNEDTRTITQSIDKQEKQRILTKKNLKLVNYNRDVLEKTPLSYSQEQEWFWNQDKKGVNLSIRLQLCGALDKDILNNSIKIIIERHQTLRSIFRDINDIAYQGILPAELWELDYEYVKEENFDSFENMISSYIGFPYNLYKDYIFSACLYDLGCDNYELVMTFNAIAGDTLSKHIIVKELQELYNAQIEEREPDLPALPLQYADYAMWQKRHIPRDILDTQLSYWESKLSRVTPCLLPADTMVSEDQGYSVSSILLESNKELSNSLQDLSKSKDTTLFVTLLAALKILLSRYSNQSDVCVGTYIDHRKQKGLEGMIGLFKNTLALRSTVDVKKSFLEFLSQVRQTTLEGYDNELVPFDTVLKHLRDNKYINCNYMFEVTFELLDQSVNEEVILRNLKTDLFSNNDEMNGQEIAFSISETKKGLQMSVKYRTNLFKEETIEQLGIHYRELLKSLIANPNNKIGDLSIITQEEQSRILEDFNTTEVSYPKNKTIIELFSEQVAKTPDQVAMVYENKKMTYTELDKKSNQLAQYLQKKGVRHNTLVGIYIDRSFEMIIGILGVLKSGGAYVPVDTEYPQERIDYMLENAGVQIVLSTANIKSRLGQHEDLDVVLLDQDWELIAMETEQPIKELVYSSNLAYVIYTSGSTGKPKGVMIEHNSLFNYILYCISNYGAANSTYNFPLFTSLSFDLTQTSIYMTLLTGGQLSVYKEQDVHKVLEMVSNTENVTSIKLTPTHLLFFKELSCKHLKEIIIGGEELFSYHLDCLQGLPAEASIYNEYGPTEATIGCIVSEVSNYKSLTTIPIGKPIDNTQIYILDTCDNPVPVGMIGELFISGSGLAKGYLNKEDLTKNKFLPNPFKKGARMYKTGDQARWLPDGNIEFIGRKDDQVKVRGYRIELGEIESQLSQLEVIQHCCVIAKKHHDGSNVLIGYVVVEGNFDKLAIQNALKSQLPDYMIPKLWLALDKLPMTTNGKIDKKALPYIMPNNLSSQEYIAPRNAIEWRLAAIWGEVLRLMNNDIGIRDNFFELGGNSILVMQLISKIKESFSESISVAQIFECNTIEKLGKLLESDKEIQTSFLIKFNEFGNKRPLFLIPPAGGIPTTFLELTTLLGEDQPIYSFQFPGIDNQSAIIDTNEELASFFIKEIQKIMPCGPYRLGGYSFGARVALEMAIQLENKGQVIEELISFDSLPVKDYKEDLGSLLINLIGSERLDLDTKNSLLKTDLTSKTKEELIDLTHDLIVSSGDFTTKRQLKVLLTNCNIVYSPGEGMKINAPIKFFKAYDSENKIHHDMENTVNIMCLPGDNNWENFTRKEVLTYPIEGATHTTIMSKPYIDDVAKFMNSKTVYIR
ncbi:non-ribosomal peptide synthetase [Aquimarina sp. RZ0]|uniref:non-ribosomal peptide synthetase n=1 Tax=Aquimarina sp. RZ0 TaxID=2607730 RepID=UPI0011F2663E|nr:non-ribosomal peptide synthetase [Aquimarina sp. RZ0]KAA1243055.1 amino acid adenylation domain-containing protein [Aquimarina sp. RZ0]